LNNLEKLGARPLSEDPESMRSYGFRDSLNWNTKEVVDVHLTPSQGMSFLALANILHDGVVWETFQHDPVVEKGLDILELKIKRTPAIEEFILDVEAP